jgi:hypothetical protein
MMEREVGGGNKRIFCFDFPRECAVCCSYVQTRHVLNNARARVCARAPRRTVTAESHIACRAHAVALRCRAAKGLECVSHLIYTVRPCLIHTCHAAPTPYSDHAVLFKATAQDGRRETACGLPAHFRLPATTRSSTKIVIRSIPILLTTIHTYECKEW